MISVESIVLSFLGLMVMLIVGVLAWTVLKTVTHAEDISALKEQAKVINPLLEKIDRVIADIAYIRGKLETEQ